MSDGRTTNIITWNIISIIQILSETHNMKASFLAISALGLTSHAMARSNPGVEGIKQELGERDVINGDVEGWNGHYYGWDDEDCEYASVKRIEQVWYNLADSDWGGFFKNFHGELNWTIMHTQPLAGQYPNISSFIVNGVVRLLDCFEGNANFSLVNIVGGCNNPWSVQETLVEGVAKNGQYANSKGHEGETNQPQTGRIIDEIVVWATKWDKNGKIEKVRSYVDSYITTMVIHENEIWSNSSWRDVKTGYIAGPYGMPNLTNYLGYDPNTLPN